MYNQEVSVEIITSRKHVFDFLKQFLALLGCLVFILLEILSEMKLNFIFQIYMYVIFRNALFTQM